MRWTIGLLLLAAAGCGYRQTKMVSCPDANCHNTYANRTSEEGIPNPTHAPADLPVYRGQPNQSPAPMPPQAPPLPPPGAPPPPAP